MSTSSSKIISDLTRLNRLFKKFGLSDLDDAGVAGKMNGFFQRHLHYLLRIANGK